MSSTRYPELEELLTNTQQKQRPQPFSIRRWATKWMIRVLSLVVILLLPFWTLIRGGVYAVQQWQWAGWPSLLFGAALTLLLLMTYLLVLLFTFRSLRKVGRFAAKSLVVLVLVFVGYGSIYISSMQTKSEEVRSYYRSLHPVLRVGVGTLALADRRLVLTDIQRDTGDYSNMNLRAPDHSLHYVQPDGYVHAVDLRTKYRSAWRNALMQGAFELMGFETLRHTGTADHLHVSIVVSTE